MYSCGSLAPKMRAGGCMDHQFRRPPEPWEIADGWVSVFDLKKSCTASKLEVKFISSLTLLNIELIISSYQAVVSNVTMSFHSKFQTFDLIRHFI